MFGAGDRRRRGAARGRVRRGSGEARRGVRVWGRLRAREPGGQSGGAAHGIRTRGFAGRADSVESRAGASC